MTDNTQLAQRLAEILRNLYQGEILDKHALAATYSVTERTIYRDLQRLGEVVQTRPDGRYELHPDYRCKIQPKHLDALATLLGAQDLLPDSSMQFLWPLLNKASNQERTSYLVKGHAYEHAKASNQLFNQLDSAIAQHQYCQLHYKDKTRTLAPYRLINHRGIWYLAATENGQLKTYTLNRCSAPLPTGETFTPNPATQTCIDESDGIWFGDTQPVTLQITGMAMYYFKRRNLLPQQTLLGETAEHLFVQTAMRHPDQILPIIRYWLPHVRVMEPASLADALKQSLAEGLEQL